MPAGYAVLVDPDLLNILTDVPEDNQNSPPIGISLDITAACIDVTVHNVVPPKPLKLNVPNPLI